MSYKLMIVDDEQVVRDRVVSLIDWNKSGFEVIAVCENGLDALECIEKDCPDLIMTDIRMPFMDGLELADYVQRHYPLVKIVFLTGFDDFNYARKAIDLRVIDYLLKPITANELRSSLERIRTKMDEHLSERRDLDRLRNYYDQSLPQLRSGFLTMLISGTMQPRQIQEGIAALTLSELDGSRFRVAILTIDESSFSQGVFSQHDHALANFGVYNIAEEICLREQIGLAFIQSDQVVVIAHPVGSQNSEQLRFSLDRILDETRLAAKRFLNLILTIGISSEVSGLIRLRRAWQEAQRALDYRLVVGSDGLIYLEDLESVEVNPPVVSKELEQQLLTAIKVGREDDLKQSVDEIMEVITSSQWPLDYVRFFLAGLVAALISEAAATGVKLDEVLPVDEMTEYLTRSNLADLDQWLTRAGIGLMRAIETNRQDSRQTIAARAMDYINQNYNDRSLSLNSISAYLHISPSYFGSVFKRETGETFVSSLLRARMEKARDLITTTSLKNFEIAAQVGYDDPHYFSVCFKRFYRMSPNDFRNNLSQRAATAEEMPDETKS